MWSVLSHYTSIGPIQGSESGASECQPNVIRHIYDMSETTQMDQISN
jgi:hypothetical protein